MVIQKPVKNYTEGRSGYHPEVICIHITEGTKESVYQHFNNPFSYVSSHYLVCKNREIWTFVDEENTAWGNGKVVNPTAKIVLDRPTINPNAYSISIETEAFTWSIIPETQYDDLAELVLEISHRWIIPLDREHIIRHNEIRADKSCPAQIDVNKIIDLALKKKLAPITPEKPVELSILQELQRQLSILWDLINRYKARSLGTNEK